MHSRKLHAFVACVFFPLLAQVYLLIAGQRLEFWRVALWSGVGVASYVLWSHAYGFDPHRTRIAACAPALVHYIDRWELRCGQATLSMLGSVILAAGLLDPSNFVTAVVSGTLASWTYFSLRLYSGGYRNSRGL
ncbi:MAG TPA: hypothetical protein VHK24_09860 [Steroidobacter sp.]|jgi:hypothetical protein|nr:hypothetical protein [Steroidobacter sp.]